LRPYNEGMNAAHKPVAKDVPIEGDERGSSGVFPVVARAADEDIPSCERPTVPVPRSAGDTVDDESVYTRIMRGRIRWM
jgi:hypothetical protein